MRRYKEIGDVTLFRHPFSNLPGFCRRKRVMSPISRKVKLVDLALRQCVGNRRRSGRDAEAVENLADRFGWMDRAKNPHAPGASRTAFSWLFVAVGLRWRA
ncbi:MAG: hypothetical protein ABSH28_24755 [Acidobacteriota bacterium]